MKVYVSGSWSHKQQIAELAEYLTRMIPGFESTSTWLGCSLSETEVDKVGSQALIQEDYYDIERADVFMLVNAHEMGGVSPGKWIELGYALANGKLCIIWGNNQTSLFLQDKATIWLPEDNRAHLVLTLIGIKVTLDTLTLGGSGANRTDTGILTGLVGGGAEDSAYEIRSEAAREGLRQREGSPLRNLVRALRGRAAGTIGNKERIGD
jgi:hypothetical protein